MRYSNVFQLVIILFFNISGYSQNYSSTEYYNTQYDSLENNEIIFRPNFEFGMLTPKSQEIKNIYKTNSIFYWGVGLQLNHPLSSSFYPYLLFNQSKYSILTQADTISPYYNTFEMKQFSFGFFYKMYKISRTIVNGKIGYSHSFINESFLNVNNQAYGFQFGIGLERRFWKKSKFYMEYSYNFQKVEKSYFRDFDNSKVSFGFCF